MSFKIITTEELIQMLNKYNHKELHMHHTWKPNHSNYNGSNGIELQENMRNYHLKVKGWSDIGQHVSLLPDGRWVTGRDFGRTPASISGYNTGAFCVEMIGDFDIGRDKFEGKQKESMLKLAKYFYDKGKYIRFHRENSTKTCPGSSIDKSVFMNEVKKHKGDEDKLELTNWQWGALEKNVRELLEEGIITSDSWVTKVHEKSLTVSELSWLNNMVLQRLR